MNSEEAKRILALYRPGIDGEEAQVAEALQQVKRDPELRHWFEQHLAFQAAMRTQMQSLPVPNVSAQDILRRKQTLRPLFGRRKAVWLAWAAAIVFGLGLAVWWTRERTPDRFADFRSRMIRSVVLQYHMDLETNNLAALLQFLDTNGAPVDFTVPGAVERLPLTGGGVLRWRGHKVSMICYDRGDKKMLFLFVVNRNALNQPPPPVPISAKVSKLITSGWSQGARAYLLAGPDDAEMQRFFRGPL